MNYSKRQIEIIEKATILIGEKGIQNLTTKNLASMMNFSEPALYRHFKNKTEILESVLIFYKNQLTKGLAEIIKSDISASEKIKSMIDFQFNHFEKNPAIIMVIFSETSFQYNSTLSELVSNIILQKSDMVENIIQTGIDNGTIRKDISASQLTTLILGTMRFTVLKWRLSNFDFDLKKEGQLIWKTIKLIILNNN